MKIFSNGVMNVICRYILRKPVKILNKGINKKNVNEKFYDIWKYEYLIDYANTFAEISIEEIDDLEYIDAMEDIEKVEVMCKELNNIAKKYDYDDYYVAHFRTDVFRTIKHLNKCIASNIQNEYNKATMKHRIYRDITLMLNNKFASKKLKLYISNKKIPPYDFKNDQRKFNFGGPIKDFEWIDNNKLYILELNELDDYIHKLF